MDLGAYVQIADLDKLAKVNGISEINRLRGYRLMRDEEPVDVEEICKKQEVEICKELCEMHWNPNNPWVECSSTTKALCKKYINNYDKIYENYDSLSINWEVMTDQEKEILKDFMEKRFQHYREQWNLWNSFCGRNDVLYIHARQGTTNWSDTTFKDYEDKPWYLAGCNDAWDLSYCDMYAKIEPFTGNLDKE